MSGGGSKNKTSAAGTVTAKNFTAEGYGKELGAAAQNAFRSSSTYNKPLYAGAGAGTNAALDTISKTAGGFQGYLDPARSQLQGIAAGNYLNNGNPYFEANLAQAKDNTYADVVASLGGTGRTGSSVHVNELTGALGNLENSARAQQYETERDRQMQAIAALPGVYEASLAPGQAQLQVGQLRDADAQARLMADYDLYQRNDPYSKISQYMSLLNQSQGTQGIAKPEKQTPWWQTALGGAAAIGSAFL